MRHTFFCIDGHTAGNPVRLVTGGAPSLSGSTMSERRADFLARFDWIRQGLMFEPRGHDMMSGGFIYPPLHPENDAAILFMETSGCLPMCGHGAIGMITFGLEHGLIKPKVKGHIRIEVPAGLVEASFTSQANKVTSVTLRNVPSFVYARDLVVDVPDLGQLKFDVAYGGNFYAIFEPQPGFSSIDDLGASGVLKYSPIIRKLIADICVPVHPLDETIRGIRHVMWTDPLADSPASGRSAVFYGSNAIDRSPCGTGTSARIAQLHARGQLKSEFVHYSIIHSAFRAGVVQETQIGPYPAIIPSIEGSAYSTGFSQMWIDDDEPFPTGFQVI
jgi:4-hydroxyproline epimerase